jgi:hypothetical protein
MHFIMSERGNTMKKFILLYKGLATPPGASHKEWGSWFKKVGDNLLDTGSGMKNGFVVHSDGSTSKPPNTLTLNGYSIVQAEDIDGVISLLKDHPYLSLGSEYSIEIFESPSSRAPSRK